MKNKKWGTTSYTDDPIYVVLFVSRKKDNPTEGFVERRTSFITTYAKDDPELLRKFNDFVRAGQSGEFCRMYYSVNSRDNEMLHKKLQIFLIEEPEFNLCSIASKIAGLAAQSDCAASKRWMFDFDIDDAHQVEEFCKDIMEHNTPEKPIDVEIHKTPHGYAVIVSRGFDYRELAAKWGKDVTLKKDDLLCVCWGTTE